MESAIPNQTLTDDVVHQRDRLCDAVRYSIQQDTDMVIISKNKQLITCHSSLLVLFSPLVARLLSSVPCCASPTIILPDFPALHISKLLHILGCGQTIPRENVNADIEIIKEVAQILQITITDLSVGHSLHNPLDVPNELKEGANKLKKSSKSASSIEAKKRKEIMEEKNKNVDLYCYEKFNEKSLLSSNDHSKELKQENISFSPVQKIELNNVGSPFVHQSVKNLNFNLCDDVQREMYLVEEEKIELSRVKQELMSANIKEEVISIKEEVIDDCGNIEENISIKKEVIDNCGNIEEPVIENIHQQEYVVQALNEKEKNVDQCVYVTAKIPQQEYIMQTQTNVLPSMKEVMEEAVQINSLPSIEEGLGAFAMGLEGFPYMHNSKINLCILDRKKTKGLFGSSKFRERKRRNECKKGFETLKELVPELSKIPKPSMLTILKKSKKYIHLLEKEHTQQRKEIMMEVERNKKMKMLLINEVNSCY